MAPKLNNGKPRRKRSTSPLNNLPGLFDHLELDLADTPVETPAFTETDFNIEERHKAQSASKQELNIDPSRLQRPSSFRFISFGSGSSGNCSFLGYDSGEGVTKGVLIDAGVEPDVVYQALRDNKIDIRSISGILLTHDHGDHVKYVYTILRANRHMVVYTTMRTMSGLLRRHSISNRIKDYHRIIYIEHPFEIGNLSVTAFRTSHDGTENVGYSINSRDGNHRFVIATDTGIITPESDNYLRKANYIVIESNYDNRMLLEGPYAEYLKARIQSDRGHLDNKVAANYIKSIVNPAVSHVFLCHLSEENNTPELAYRTMYEALLSKGLKIGDPTNPLMTADSDIALAVLPRRATTPLFLLRHKNK